MQKNLKYSTVALQRYSFEMNNILKLLIDYYNDSQNIGVEEIEYLLGILVIPIEKILKVVLILDDKDISDNELKKIGHDVNKLYHRLQSSNNLELDEENQEQLDKYIFLISIMGNIEKRYEEIDIIQGNYCNQHQYYIYENMSDYIGNNSSDYVKDLLKYIIINTCVFIYYIEILLLESKKGIESEALVSMIDNKISTLLRVMHFVDRERKIYLLNVKIKDIREKILGEKI